MSPNRDTGESLGIVIGYAAAPGEVALDGPAGANSPYAAALLKHLGANDFDFADVMTMVSEEVYLSTRSQQQPWTNASLRRLLYFGNAVEADDGDEAQIRGARRDLLLTIATEPKETRSLVEALSQNDTVPLDALYGMLKELDVDTSAGPDELARQLKAGAENLRRIVDKGVDVSARNDPELTRYAELADRAQAEGALGLSRQFRERASARADTLRESLDRRQDELQADRIEIAATYAEEAQAALLSFDGLRAAERYRDAYEQVRRWDDRLAWRYKTEEGTALADYGDRVGDRSVIERAIDAHRQALVLVSKSDNPEDWATSKHGAGIALSYLARVSQGVDALDDAVASLEESLQVRTKEKYPDQWASTRLAIGNAAMAYGHVYGDAAWLQRSAEAYADAAAMMRGRVYDWTTTQRNLGLALYLQGYYTNDPAVLRQSVAAYARVLRTWTREDMPQLWALAEADRAKSLLAIAALEQDDAVHRQGLEAIRAVARRARPKPVADGLGDRAALPRRRGTDARQAIARSRRPAHRHRRLRGRARDLDARPRADRLGDGQHAHGRRRRAAGRRHERPRLGRAGAQSDGRGPPGADRRGLCAQRFLFPGAAGTDRRDAGEDGVAAEMHPHVAASPPRHYMRRDGRKPAPFVRRRRRRAPARRRCWR